jgi:glycosyltransferase involved in cell wall biosynthesis
MAELEPLTSPTTSPDGHIFTIEEVLLVWDRGPVGSDQKIRDLAATYPWVKPIWLSKNYGQHAATLAGMTSSGGDWVVTMDEDGQHDPDSIGVMLDQAVSSNSQVVYGAPAQSTAHGRMRNITSGGAKRVASLLSGSNMPLLFSSYRIISGEIGRSLAAYAGPSVYLDVALSWIVNRATVVDVNYREERRPNSGYSYRSLLGHFWKLALTTGTRPLRYVRVGGGVISLVGIALAIRIVIDKIYFGISATGWASVVVAVMTLGGFTLLALGIIAEYVGLIVRSTFGQPTYLAIRDPKKSPVHGIGSGPQGQ